jgi:hypothetical protein
MTQTVLGINLGRPRLDCDHRRFYKPGTLVEATCLGVDWLNF